MNKPSILIIDDEPQIQRLLEINLTNNGFKILQASTGKEGLLLAASHTPDIILLDLGLPDIDGHLLLQDLRQWFTKAIIILSVQDSEQSIVSALDNGATDYLTKPFRTGELLARIRAALSRNSISNDTSKIVIENIEIDLVNHLVKKDNETIKLTLTEFNLLVLLAKNEGRVLTHQYILKEIWGIPYQTETQYLRVFISQLRKKIEVNANQPKHILTESGIGYRFQ